jgi:citrate lyase beta subunit
LGDANARVSHLYPGDSGRRQPIHTVYGGAHLFAPDISRKLGEKALRSMAEYAPDANTFARALGVSEAVSAKSLYSRVKAKLHREPVEDFRLDFEDGFGIRPDEEEDKYAVSTAELVAAGMKAGQLPPFIGIRIKSLSAELHSRAIRTLGLFVTTLVKKAAGQLPDNFIVTLPKVVAPEQVTALVEIFQDLERATGLPPGSFKMEFMVEVPQTIFNERGESNLPHILAAAQGRCVAAHFGTYDYTAGCGITAAHQQMTHPACDFAKHMMQVSLAGTGIWLSDGATNIMPVPVHTATRGRGLSAKQKSENRDSVHRAWAIQFSHIQRSLIGGFYQGWDLHPAQLPARYAAVYAFFLENLPASSERLRNFVSKSAQATRVGEVFDDAATGQALLNYFLRAINCGAITETEALPLTGLTAEELRRGSFLKILEGRSSAATRQYSVDAS